MSERRTLYEKSRSQKVVVYCFRSNGIRCDDGVLVNEKQTTRQLQQQLEQERSLKREAFHLVSGLQEKVR